MARLPVPGADDGAWGNLLNNFLSVEHAADGSLKIRTDGTFYAKPAGGIPATDLTGGAQTSLGLANSSLQPTLFTTKGDLLSASASATTGRLGVGSDGQVLTADSSQSTGLKWGPVAGASVFNIQTYGATTGAADNKSAIDAALTAAAVGGGVVYIPPGTWSTTGQHTVPLNVSVQGAGKASTTISHKGVGTYCFFIGSNVAGANPPNYMGKIGSFSLQGQSSGDGTGQWGQQVGIYILNCLFFNVQDVHSSVIYKAILIDGGDEVALGAGTFAGNGYISNLTSSNVFIGMHVYRWVTDTTYNFVYGYGNSPITTGSIGIWFDTKPSTSTLVNSSVEGFDTGVRISTSRQGLAFINPRLENCNTYVLWENNTWGHLILGGSAQPGIWATGTSAGSVTQIARDGLFPAITALPAASSSYRHAVYRVDGGAGIADGIYICTKDASGNYAWHEITTGNTGGTGSSAGNPGPTDQGLFGWTFDPTAMGSGGTALTSQRIQYARVAIPTGGTITGVAIQVTGAPTSASNTFLGLYNSSGTRVAVTAEVSASVGTTGTKQLAFTATYAAAAGTYYVGIVQTGAPAMSLCRAGLGSATAYNLGTASAPFRFNTGATGQTALPASVTLGSVSASSDAYWMALY